MGSLAHTGSTSTSPRARSRAAVAGIAVLVVAALLPFALSAAQPQAAGAGTDPEPPVEGSIWEPDLVSATASGEAAADGESRVPRVSDDGRFVLFRSSASNLTGVPDGNDGLFLKDRLT